MSLNCNSSGCSGGNASETAQTLCSFLCSISAIKIADVSMADHWRFSFSRASRIFQSTGRDRMIPDSEGLTSIFLPRLPAKYAYHDNDNPVSIFHYGPIVGDPES